MNNRWRRVMRLNGMSKNDRFARTVIGDELDKLADKHVLEIDFTKKLSRIDGDAWTKMTPATGGRVIEQEPQSHLVWRGFAKIFTRIGMIGSSNLKAGKDTLVRILRDGGDR